MATKDFHWLQERTKFWLDANPLQADASFSTNLIKQAINEAYETEINQAKTESALIYFYKLYNFTWPASQSTYDIEGTPLEFMDKYAFVDVTDGEDKGYTLLLQWRDNKTLFWGDENGPGSARTIRCIYLANAEELKADGDQPTLIQPNHRDLLPLAAASLLRMAADEMVPPRWENELTRRRMMWWKEMQANPRTDVARVKSVTMTDGLDFNRFNSDPFYR